MREERIHIPIDTQSVSLSTSVCVYSFKLSMSVLFQERHNDLLALEDHRMLKVK